MPDSTYPAGEYELQAHLSMRDEVPPGHNPDTYPIRHFHPGEVVTLSEEQATRLMSFRNVKPVEKKKPRKAAAAPSLSEINTDNGEGDDGVEGDGES